MRANTSPAAAEPLPARPGDWVSNGIQLGRLHGISRFEGEVLIDIVLYGVDGTRIGRESPALGGPRGFEPMVPFEGWSRIRKPDFPLAPSWIPNEDGSSSLGYMHGEALPDLEWVPQEPRRASRVAVPREDLVEALRKISDGHNDPRGLAAAVLGRHGLTAGSTDGKDA